MNQEIAQKITGYKSRGYESVLLGLCDIDGVLRGKYVNLDKFASLLEKGGGFCNCVFGWDIDDQVHDAVDYTGWHTGFPDTHYRLLTATERYNSLTNTPFFLGEFSEVDGSEHPLCPRTLLRKVIDCLAQKGYQVKAGFEYEFFVFQETSRSVREKDYKDLVPLTEGNFGYSILRAATHSENFTGLLKFCKDFAIPLEGLHCESGPGVWEAALTAEPVLEAADRASLFKSFSKVYFQQQNQIATYMAKWHMSYPGQSGHFHFSLLDSNGQNVLSSEGSALNEQGNYLMGGLTHYLPELLALFAPTVNSYTRLVRGAWAPTAANWGIENRTCAVRWVAAKGNEHIEHRVPGADSNPYLVAAATLAACILGLEEHIEPPPPIVGNGYDEEPQVEQKFGTNLQETASRLQNSTSARRILGDTFIDHFVKTRYWEHSESQRTISEWQLRRYFESV